MKYLYSILLSLLTVYSASAGTDPTSGLKEIGLSGLTTADGHTFHFYSTSGTLHRGYSEVYIALTDSNQHFVENFSVSDFRPLMNMGTTKHSTPIGKVEKVVGKPLYKTWFSFLMYTGQMGGAWSLSFNYTIGDAPSPQTLTGSSLLATSSTLQPTNDTLTQIGWFKDRHCVGAVTLPLSGSCGIGCGTGAGNMANCWNGGLGVFKYTASESGTLSKVDARSEEHFLLFDAQSKELARAFLLALPTDASGKISVKVTGYIVPNGITANATESNIPELNPDSVTHTLNAFHVLSIEGTVIENQLKSYAGFSQQGYRHTPADLAPSALHLVNYSDGATVHFTPPGNAGKAKSNLTGYKVQLYTPEGVLLPQYTTISNDASTNAIDISGFRAKSGTRVTVSALYAASNVEVESIPSEALDSSVTGIVLPVANIPTGTKWIQSFTYKNATYYLSIVQPEQLTTGVQTVKAYVNKQVDNVKPYAIEEGGFNIVPSPFMRSMGHGSSGNSNLLWNATEGVYEGTLNFSMEGDWRVNLKIYDAAADTLIAGNDPNDLGDGGTHYWDLVVHESTTANAELPSNDFEVFPTVSKGFLTIVAPTQAKVQIVNLYGTTLTRDAFAGSKTLPLDYPNGLYFVVIETPQKTYTRKIILSK